MARRNARTAALARKAEMAAQTAAMFLAEPYSYGSTFMKSAGGETAGPTKKAANGSKKGQSSQRDLPRPGEAGQFI